MPRRGGIRFHSAEAVSRVCSHVGTEVATVSLHDAALESHRVIVDKGYSTAEDDGSEEVIPRGQMGWSRVRLGGRDDEGSCGVVQGARSRVRWEGRDGEGACGVVQGARTLSQRSR